MKISILLPLKENFSPTYAGAVSLFINDTLKLSKFRKKITVFGHTNFKKKFNYIFLYNYTYSFLYGVYRNGCFLHRSNY